MLPLSWTTWGQRIAIFFVVISDRVGFYLRKLHQLSLLKSSETIKLCLSSSQQVIFDEKRELRTACRLLVCLSSSFLWYQGTSNPPTWQSRVCQWGFPLHLWILNFICSLSSLFNVSRRLINNFSNKRKSGLVERDSMKFILKFSLAISHPKANK